MNASRLWRAFIVALLLALGMPGMLRAAPLFPGLFPDHLVNFGPRPVLNYSGSWTAPPTVSSASFDPGGGGYGLTSGYQGTYTDANGNVKIASVSLTSLVFPSEKPRRYDYFWTITNSGTGDFVQWFGPKPPDFLMGVLKPGDTQKDSRLEKGPPVLANWGGRWNPEVGEEAPKLEPSPVPLPAAAVLLGGAVGLLMLIGAGRERPAR